MGRPHSPDPKQHSDLRGLLQEFNRLLPLQQEYAARIRPDAVLRSFGVQDQIALGIDAVFIALRPLQNQNGFHAGVAMQKGRRARFVPQQSDLRIGP